MIIGITGQINTGKDTVGAMVAKHLDGVIMRFADSLKVIALDLFPDKLTHEALWGPSELRTPEIRTMLQGLGTDVARKFDPDIWVMRLLGRALNYREYGEDALDLLPNSEPNKHIVVTDVRFINEAEALTDVLGGYVLRITRPDNFKNTSAESAAHLSETEGLLIPEKLIHATLVNDGTLEELEAKVLAAIETMEE